MNVIVSCSIFIKGDRVLVNEYTGDVNDDERVKWQLILHAFNTSCMARTCLVVL